MICKIPLWLLNRYEKMLQETIKMREVLQEMSC